MAEQTLWPFGLNRVYLPQDGDVTAKWTPPFPISEKRDYHKFLFSRFFAVPQKVL